METFSTYSSSSQTLVRVVVSSGSDILIHMSKYSNVKVRVGSVPAPVSSLI